VLAHDSRTLELARYFRIPHRPMTEVDATTDPADLYAEADYGPLLSGHAERFARFIAYLERHGLRHVFAPGEDPSAFDRQVAATTYPPAITTPGWIGRMRRRGQLTAEAIERRARRAARALAR
jgi:hypothetical protein